MSPPDQPTLAAGQHGAQRGWRWVALGCALVPAFVVLGAHVLRYYPFISDDSLISLRYCRRLLAGHGLTWTDGERVEGYSNLLWILGCAALGALRIDLIAASRILGVLGIGGAMACVAASRRMDGIRGWIGGATGALTLGVAGCMAVWTIGGLEQPLVAVLLAGAILLVRPLAEGAARAGVIAPSILLALLCWTRPDGPLLVALVALAVFLAAGPSRVALWTAIRLGAPSAGAVILQLVFRLAYYHDWIPNSARAKIVLTATRLSWGIGYCAHALAWYAPLFALAILLPILGRARRSTVLLLGLPALGWMLYVVFIGGDIFPAYRHMVLILVLAGFAIAAGMAGALRERARGTAAVVATVLALGLQVPLTLHDPENLRAVDERWEWDGEVVGRLLRQAFSKEQPLLAAEAAGCMPYFSQLPSIDMLGLNDRYLATHRPPDMGQGWMGHELGSGDYILSREPDLVIMEIRGPGDPSAFRSAAELIVNPSFRDAYELVAFVGFDPRPLRQQIWVRREGRIGIRRTPDAIQVPGYLLAASAGGAVLHEGRIGAALAPGAVAGLRLALDGPWDIAVQASGPVTGTFSPDGIAVRAGPMGAHIRGISLTRR